MHQTRFMVPVFVCALLAVSPAAFGQFTFVGPSGGDFFDTNNWEDGGGLNPASIIDGGTGFVELDLLIDGDTVAAASDVNFGSGSLEINSSGVLNVNAGQALFGSGSSLTLTDATLNVLNDSSSQIQLNLGSTSIITDSIVNATDDIFFRGSTTVLGSSVTSVADDIEFRDTATIGTVADSSFTVLDASQSFIVQLDGTFTNVTVTSGRFSMETGVDLTVVDSTINLSGDIEDVFNSPPVNATLFLEGDSDLFVDQLEEGIKIVLRDQSTATFFDEVTETAGSDDGQEWITHPDSMIIFESTQAMLVFFETRGIAIDDNTQIFNDVDGLMLDYAGNPLAFTPSDWNGLDAVTIQAVQTVPAPAAFPAGLLAVAVTLAGRRRRSAR